MQPCQCTVAGGGNLQCHDDGPGNTGSAPQNWIWFDVGNISCCSGGAQGGGVHPMCQGHSCDWLHNSTCIGSIVLSDTGEQEALWGYISNLTFETGSTNIGNTGTPGNQYILSETSYKAPTTEFNFEQFNFEPGECQDAPLGLVTLPPISGAEGGPPSCPCGWGPNGIPKANNLGIYQATWQPWIIPNIYPYITVEHTHPACMTWYDYILQGPSYLDTIPMNPCWQEYLTMPFCIDHANGNNWAAAIGAGWANCRLASDLQAMTNAQRKDIFDNTYSAFGPNGWTNPSHTLGVHPGTPPTAWIPVFIMNSFGLPSNQPNPLPPHQNGGWAVPAMRWFKIDATGSMNYQACFLENLACPNTCLGCTDLTSTTCITNPGACQAYDPTTSYFWPDLSSYPTVGWPPSSMDCCVSGCTTPGDPNYNPLATCDDGSCVYGGPIYGCMDPNAVICSTNPACSAYDSAATIDDGTCCIQGCTNSNATNYNILANCDDGSCVYPPVPGCMDSNAINYMDCCDLTIPGCVPTIQYDACCKYEDGREKTKCHCCNKFGQAVMPNNNDYTDCSTLDGTLNTPATGIYNCVPVSQTLNCKKPLPPTTIDGSMASEYSSPPPQSSTPCIDFITTMSPSEAGTWGSSGDIDCCMMYYSFFIGPYGSITPSSMLQTHCDQEWININGPSAVTSGWTSCCTGGRPIAPTIEYDKKISEDTRDGVYFTPSREEWSGTTHRMPGGTLMSGNPHDIDGSGSEGRSETLTEIYTVYLTPSGKQWCGDMHESMLGTIMSGKERNVWGSGPDGKSELLSKNTIKNSLSGTPYKSCKTDDPSGKPAWDCTSIGCMLLPPWWTQGQFTGPNAYINCMTACTSWKCIETPFCHCHHVHGTGASQTYPTYPLCDAAAHTDPCCTDDYNTYNCTINGCEVHIGPGFGTYSQSPYALWECQQDCIAWGCHDVLMTSAYTTTGLSYTDFAYSTPHMSAQTGTAVVWTSAITQSTTMSDGDTCIHVYYDASSMGAQLVTNAEQAISDWRDQQMQPGGILSGWSGIFISTNMNQDVGNSPPSTVVNGVGGTKDTSERWLTWPWMTLNLISNQGGAMPCIPDPQNLTSPPSIPHSYSQLLSMSCSCRSVLVISLCDESNSLYNNGVSYVPQATFDIDRTNYITTYNNWNAAGGTLYHLVYPASENNQQTNIMQSIQIFLATQGTNFDTANNGNVLTYDPTWNNVSHINGNPIFGNPAQSNLAAPLVHNFTNWIETPMVLFSNYTGNPFLGFPSINSGNPYEPLEDYGTFGIYNRRGLNAFTISTLGDDLTEFLVQNPIVQNQVSWTSANTVTSTTVHWLTWTYGTYTGITSNTVTTTWTVFDVCLSAETIPYIDYPYPVPPCHDMCERPGYDCGVDGCYEQWNGEFFDEHNCEVACRSWSCVTKTGGLTPEGGFGGQPPGAQEPLACVETIEDSNGVTFSLHQPITGDTYDYVEYCFGIFQPVTVPATIYPPNVGLILGGLWDNTGTSWVQGVTTTTIQNGLVVHDLGGGNCKTWHPDYPYVPGRITNLSSFRLVDLNGVTIFAHVSQTSANWGTTSLSPAVDIMNELTNGVGHGWSNASPPPLPPFALYSPDWPNGMPDYIVTLDQLIAYGNNTTGDNYVKEFTVEVDVYGCPCEQLCNCELIPGQDPTNPTTWALGSPNAWQLCTDECCEKTKTWKCPDLPIHRHLLCNSCPNGGGCYDPLDGSGLHSTQSLCEDDCAVSYDCFSATPISAVTSYSANTTCGHVDYTMVGGQYLYLLPYSGIPVSYFQGQEPTGTQNGNFTVVQNNFSGWTWGRWSDIFPATNIIKEAFKFNYGAAQGANFGGISNAFEAFIYIFDERKGYHDTEFNKIGFWTGNLWDNDTTHTCEYPSPQGDKELGVMDGFRNNEFSTMFCIDYEIRHNKRPWVSTLDPLLNGIPHPYAEYQNGVGFVQGAATMCGRKPGNVVSYQNTDNNERYITHSLADNSSPICPWLVGNGWFGTCGDARSQYKRYTFKSVKDLKEKIHWMYSQPDYVDTYGWSNLSLYNSGLSLGQSRNETNLQSGACTRLGRDLAKLYNPGPMTSLCTDYFGVNYTVPHPSNGLKDTTTTFYGLQLKDFWSIGMFRNRHPGVEWNFTPAMNYWDFERAGETGLSIAYNNQRIKYNSFMTLGPGDYNLYPGVTSLGIYAYGQYLGPAEAYGLMGRSMSIFGNAAAHAGYVYIPDNSGTNYLGPVLACQCEMPCYCEIINGDQGDYEFKNQCHSNCCPDYYYSICCQLDTTSPTTSIPPFQVSCLYSITNCQCPTGSHQVACPW